MGLAKSPTPSKRSSNTSLGTSKSARSSSTAPTSVSPVSWSTRSRGSSHRREHGYDGYQSSSASQRSNDNKLSMRRHRKTASGNSVVSDVTPLLSEPNVDKMTSKCSTSVTCGQQSFTDIMAWQSAVETADRRAATVLSARNPFKQSNEARQRTQAAVQELKSKPIKPGKAPDDGDKNYPSVVSHGQAHAVYAGPGSLQPGSTAIKSSGSVVKQSRNPFWTSTKLQLAIRTVDRNPFRTKKPELTTINEPFRTGSGTRLDEPTAYHNQTVLPLELSTIDTRPTALATISEEPFHKGYESSTVEGRNVDEDDDDDARTVTSYRRAETILSVPTSVWPSILRSQTMTPCTERIRYTGSVSYTLGEPPSVTFEEFDSDTETVTSCSRNAGPNLLDRLMADFVQRYYAALNGILNSGHMRVVHQSGTSSSTGSASNSSDGTSHTGSNETGSSQSGSSPPSAGKKHGRSNDREGSDDRQESERRKRINAGPAGPSRKLACPYYKRRPHIYQSRKSCPGPGWDSVHRLK